MNYLSIDYGSKRVGLAYTVNNIIFTLPQINNDNNTLSKIQKFINSHTIGKIYVGLSEGKFAQKTLDFVNILKKEFNVPVETVEESVSTIEANQLRPNNPKKNDSVSAAIILNRALGV
jgi:RNase H-fold protein (predicted Holliday junction resolvase)